MQEICESELLDPEIETEEEASIVPSQLERIASLEESVKSLHFQLRIAALIVVAWVGWLTVTTISLQGDVRAIKQKIADGVSGPIVAQILSPKSPAQLSAALAAVADAALTAQTKQTKINPQKVDNLSVAVNTAINRDPAIPQAWQAASALINLRSAGFVSEQITSCDRSVVNVVVRGGPDPADMVGTATVSNCVLDLDKPDLWSASKSVFHLESQGKIIANWHLVLHNVVVHYSGAPLPHVSEITFDHCILDFNVPTQPSPAGQKLILTLLNQKIGSNQYDAFVS